MIFTLAFLKGAGERAVKTFSQTLAALIGAGQLGVLDVDWVTVLSVAGLAAIPSVLTSVGNADFTAGEVTERGHSSVD